MATSRSAASSGTAAPAVASASAVAYENGELVIAASATAPEQRIQDDEILFIVRRQEHDGHPEEYHVCWLRESAATAATAAPSDESEQPPPPPFAFYTTVLDEAAAKKIPSDVLRRHILADIASVFRDDDPTAPSSSSLHVVVSTRSGLGQAQAFYDGVLQPLLSVFGLTAVTNADDAVPRGQKSYNLLVTSSSRSIAEFAQTLGKACTTSTGAPTTIVLLSGDGGVVDLLNGVAEQSDEVDARQLPAIALLPLGTGNALFHSLHRPDYLAAAAAAAATQDDNDKPAPKGPSSFVLGLRTLFKGHAAPLPNFEAHFSPGSHTVSYSLQEEEGKEATLKEQAENVDRLRGAIVASYGFHAQLVWESDTPEYRKHGDKRFGMAAQELLKTSHAYDADVSLVKAKAKPHRLGHRFNYILASMVSNLEKTFTISPASEPLDGQLRLVHFGDVGGTQTMDIMMAAYNNGAHVGMTWQADEQSKEESVGYDAIDELQVNVLEQDARWRKVCIDGTIVEIPQGGWMKVRKAPQPVLQIIVNPK
ncbi:hypothetical protein SEUCBS139899_001469 [Sporothrix eucalyptigena]